MALLPFDVAVCLAASDLAGTPHEGNLESAIAAVQTELAAFPGVAAASVVMLLPEPDEHTLRVRLTTIGWKADVATTDRLELTVAAAVRLALCSPRPTPEPAGS